jgi:hypothetical protein
MNPTDQAPTARSIPAWGTAPGTGPHITPAPTARPIPAWGVAPGTGPCSPQGLKARPIPISIPQILLVAFQPILLEKRAKLLLKTLRAVMRLLCIDVTNQFIQIRRPNRKHTISPLPRELRQCRRLSLEPFRRRRFELLHQLRCRRRARQTNRKVNMVRNAADAIALAFGVTGNGSKIGVKGRTQSNIQDRCTIFRTKDHMNKQKRERLRHRADYRLRFQHLDPIGSAIAVPVPTEFYTGRATPAPTARPMPAGGEAPGTYAQNAPRAEARPIDAQPHTLVTSLQPRLLIKF